MVNLGSLPLSIIHDLTMLQFVGGMARSRRGPRSRGDMSSPRRDTWDLELAKSTSFLL